MKTASVIEKKTRISLATTFSLSCLWLFCLFCNTLHAEAPSWWSQSNVVTQQYVMAIMARVQTPDGTIQKTPGSRIAVFHGEPTVENLRAVAVFDDDDGYYFYNLTVAVVSTSESGYTFFYYDPIEDKISNLELPAEYKDTPLPFEALGYGGFPPPDYEFKPFMLTLPEEPVPTNPTVTWNLKTGWNWVSMNVVPENASVASLLAEYTPTSGDQIKSSTTSSTYYVTSKFTGWSPALNLQPGVMYMLRRQASDAATIEISGTPCAVDNTIDVKVGWNWIGLFNNKEATDITSLVHSGGFANSDQIKGQTVSATYYVTSKFTGWSGNLKQLSNNQGYKLKVTNPGTLSFAGETRGHAAETPVTRSGSCPWPEPNSATAYNMTFCAVIKKADAYLENTDTVVGIFQGDTIIGKAVFTETPFGNVYEGFIYNDASKVENLAIKIWDGEANKETTLDQTTTFEADTAWGNEFEPVELVTTVTDGPGWDEVDVYKPYNMTFCAVIKKAGAYLENADTIVGIFQGDTIIGKAVFTESPFGNVYEGFIYNKATKVENLAIKIWDGEAKKETTLDQTTTFEADTVWGDEYEPVELNLGEIPIPDTYTVTVENGTPETIDALEGEIITIKANEPEEHKLFEKWTSTDGVEFADAFAAETTFTMLAKNVTVTANYIPEPIYTITVNNGSADKTEAYEGETVIVTADEPEEHMRFDKWTSDYDPINNTTANPLPVGMPAKNVTVTANYVPEPKYTITVENGKPDKDTAYASDTVTVTAGEPEAGFVFDKWTSEDGVEFADASAVETTFTMPAKNVTVTATYKSTDQSLRFWLEADSTTVAPGDVVVVRLMAKNLAGSGMLSFGCDVNFNAADLEATSVVNSEIFSAAVGGVIVENGIKGLSGTSENDSVGVDGEPVELATMEFVVKNTAAANISIDLRSFNGSVVDATVEDGALKISGDALTLNVDGGTAVVPAFAIEFEAHQPTRAANVALKVGMAENASVAYDAAEGDVTAFPAFENVYDIRVIDGRRAEELQTDIRGLANRETWNVQVTVGEGQSLTLDWSEAELPEYFNFTIVKGKYFNDSEVIDMAEDKFMAFDEGVTYITIIADKKASVVPEATYTFNLTPGWNLIGIPFEMDAESLAKFTSVLAVYTYDDVTQAYIQYEDTTALSAGCAYWVFVNEAIEITVTGAAIEAEGVALKAGWNWVTPLKDSVLALPQGVVKTVWFYTPDGYRQATEDDEIQIGCGYWVYSAEDTVIWQTK